MTDYFPPPRDLRPGSTVWAYLRDSGGPAQENSVKQQESEIRAYCDRHGLLLIELFRDVAKSGGSVIGRDDFERMIDTSKEKDFRPRGLLIWNFARFARDTVDSTFYKALLRKRGIIIHSMTDPIPDDDFGSRIVETVLDLSNEEKLKQISRDVKRALKSLVSQGFAPGTPPRGYLRVRVQHGEKRDGNPRMVSKWERDPALWDLVILAWTMRAAGKSYQEIQAATAGRLYTSTPSWHSFFQNKSYLGSLTSGEYENPDHHEAAITWEIWEAVQNLRQDRPLKANHPRHPRRVGSPSLLTGFTYCLECGAMMTHSPGSKGRKDKPHKPWRFYVCGRKDRQGVKACSSRRVGEKRAENAIMNAVIEKVLSVVCFEDVIRSARAQFGDVRSVEKKISALQEKVTDLEIAIRRMNRAYEKTGSDLSFERIGQLESERAQVKAEIAQTESQLAASKLEIAPEAMQIVLDAWREQVGAARKSNDIKFVRAWLYRFVSRIELGYNRARIYYTYPMSDFSRGTLPLRGGT